MTAGEEEQKRGQARGFAGLSSLVSNVDATLRPAPNKETTETYEAPRNAIEHPLPHNSQPEPQPRQRPSQSSSQSPSGSFGGKWLLGVVAAVGVIWLFKAADDKPSSSAPVPTPSVQTQSTVVPSSPALPQRPQVTSRPEEEKPPVGQSLTFSMAQIRYCLAEDIRIAGAKSIVNNYSGSDVDRFNAMVADYNSRCGSFRHRRGTLESARQDIELYRSQLQAEGRSRLR